MDFSQLNQETSEGDDLYRINWVPKEFFLKLRKNAKGYQLGLNFELNNFQLETCYKKIVFKPLKSEKKWKFIFEPDHGDICLMTSKVAIGSFLRLQLGIGHCFQSHTTGLKWKLTTSLGGDGISSIQHKLSLPIRPGVDVRLGWNADFLLPDIHGSTGTEEPIIGMNVGRLTASLDRLEAILTHGSGIYKSHHNKLINYP
eukprot:TRINITY_DN6787_c0_g1_i1.p1 TRINITY_DN6787_c0_g1~~TRINITY_DN6787_c0_g1_i1.p1  ORF type:complete len:200 (+),score=36.13 TRINITY_DN6787_c0_g1_i1:325-924(+)